MASKNDAVNESISALLDGEHSELDLRRILKASQTDQSVNDTWASYNLTRQVIKKELQLTCDDGFLAGIQDAIASEQLPSAKKNPPRWFNFAGKAAVAACFTFAFLIGADQWSQSNTDAESTTIAADGVSAHESLAVVPDGFELPPLTARTVSSVPSTNAKPSSYSAPTRVQYSDQAQIQLQQIPLSIEQQALLHQLMLRHVDASASNGSMSVLPYTRVSAEEAIDFDR